MGSQTDGKSDAVATKGYYDAAAARADRIDAGPIQLDNLAQRMKQFALDDPNRGMKLALAARVAQHVRSSTEDARHAQVVDIGCGVGADVGMMLAELQECAGMKGMDLMDAVLEQARLDYPAPTVFLKGDVHDLSFLGDDSQDVVRCSRVLIHADIQKAHGEIIRILRPGGLALLVEGDLSQVRLESEDAVAQKVFEVQKEATMALVKNPTAAADIYEHLAPRTIGAMHLAPRTLGEGTICPLPGHAAVQRLAIESDVQLVAGGSYAQQHLALLAGKVEAGAVGPSELDHYSKAVLAGDVQLPSTMFTVSFTKKHLQ